MSRRLCWIIFSVQKVFLSDFNRNFFLSFDKKNCVWQKRFLNVWNIFLIIKFFWHKCDLRRFCCNLIDKTYRISFDSFSAGVSKWLSRCPEELFEDKVFCISFSWKSVHFLSKLSKAFNQKIWTSLSILLYNLLWEKFFLREEQPSI